VSPKRSKLQIYLDVLKAIKKDTHKPTRIMYRTNLSWNPLMKILDSLIDQELIIAQESDRHTRYHITEKGRNVLEYFGEAMQMIEINQK
jgi:predicted transcriptional regulator